MRTRDSETGGYPESTPAITPACIPKGPAMTARTPFTTLRLSAAIATIATTLTLILTHTMEAAAHQDIVPEPAELLLAMGVLVSAVAWIAAANRDAVIRHIDQQTATVAQLVADVLDEAGDRHATQARLDTIAAYGAPTRPSPRPGGRLGVVE
jgi:hypothetical protein